MLKIAIGAGLAFLSVGLGLINIGPQRAVASSQPSLEKAVGEVMCGRWERTQLGMLKHFDASFKRGMRTGDEALARSSVTAKDLVNHLDAVFCP